MHTECFPAYNIYVYNMTVVDVSVFIKLICYNRILQHLENGVLVKQKIR